MTVVSPTRGRYPSLDSGELRHRITFLTQQIVADSSGNKITWAAGNPPIVVYAKIDPIRLSEIIKGGQDISQQYLTITMRYRSGISASMRVQAPSGNVYIIRAIENVLELNAVLILSCVGLGDNQ